MVFKGYIVLELVLLVLLLTGCSAFVGYIEPLRDGQHNFTDTDDYVAELRDIYNNIEDIDTKGLISLIITEQSRGSINKKIIDRKEVERITDEVSFIKRHYGELEDQNMQILDIIYQKEERNFALYEASVKEPMESADIAASMIYMFIEVDDNNANKKPYKVYAFKTQFNQQYTGEGMEGVFIERVYYYQNLQ